MTKIRVPKEINDKTRYIKAFCKKLAAVGTCIDLEDHKVLAAAEYYYQSAKLEAEEAAVDYSCKLYTNKHPIVLWPASASRNA